MPIYDYACTKCGHEFEREQRIVEDPIKKCPACGAMKAKRLISKTSFVLKGGGWYNDLYSSTGNSGTDSKSESSSDSESSGSSAETKSSSKSESKSDSKSKTKDKKSGKSKKSAA